MPTTTSEISDVPSDRRNDRRASSRPHHVVDLGPLPGGVPAQQVPGDPAERPGDHQHGHPAAAPDACSTAASSDAGVVPEREVLDAEQQRHHQVPEQPGGRPGQRDHAQNVGVSAASPSPAALGCSVAPRPDGSRRLIRGGGMRARPIGARAAGVPALATRHHVTIPSISSATEAYVRDGYAAWPGTGPDRAGPGMVAWASPSGNSAFSGMPPRPARLGRWTSRTWPVRCWSRSRRNRLLGIEVLHAADGVGVVALVTSDAVTNVIGSLHSSGLTALADAAGLAAVIAASEVGGRLPRRHPARGGGHAGVPGARARAADRRLHPRPGRPAGAGAGAVRAARPGQARDRRRHHRQGRHADLPRHLRVEHPPRLARPGRLTGSGSRALRWC